ncbi:MAG: XTP/dITP diphosphatase [Elusimicrobiota bacterium]|nr:XTP/dITP diphosphatase [Elusimicrobiota bacterium]
MSTFFEFAKITYQKIGGIMKELILSTGNKHKIEEIRDILKDLPIKITPISDFPQFPHTIEDGDTLAQNAVKKAKEAAAFFNKWAIADDTGLEVEALNGAPGVYSARYAGESCSYEDNNKKLLKELSGLPKEKRKACFKCAIAMANPNGQIWTAEGRIDGIIGKSQSGANGFGYDPIFFVEEYNKSFAELSPQVKNQISHRAKALQKMKEKLKDIINML